jgi:hypothetical protein
LPASRFPMLQTQGNISRSLEFNPHGNTHLKPYMRGSSTCSRHMYPLFQVVILRQCPAPANIPTTEYYHYERSGTCAVCTWNCHLIYGRTCVFPCGLNTKSRDMFPCVWSIWRRLGGPPWLGFSLSADLDPEFYRTDGYSPISAMS